MCKDKRCKAVIFHIAITSAYYLAALRKSICYLSISIIKPKSHVRLAFSICCMICLGTNSRGMTADLKMIHSVNRHVLREWLLVQILQINKCEMLHLFSENPLQFAWLVSVHSFYISQATPPGFCLSWSFHWKQRCFDICLKFSQTAFPSNRLHWIFWRNERLMCEMRDT